MWLTVWTGLFNSHSNHWWSIWRTFGPTIKCFECCIKIESKLHFCSADIIAKKANALIFNIVLCCTAKAFICWLVLAWHLSNANLESNIFPKLYFFKVHFSKEYFSKVYFCKVYPTCVSSKLYEFNFFLPQRRVVPPNAQTFLVQKWIPQTRRWVASRVLGSTKGFWHP